MLHDAEFQTQIGDGRFVPSLGDPQIVDRPLNDARVSSQESPADADPTDGMSDVARDSFRAGLAFSRVLARYAADHPVHESKDAAAEKSAQPAAAAKE